MSEILTEIIKVCIIPLLGILTKYFISFLSAKKKELDANTTNATAKKYTDMIYNTVVNCVIATNQTYVDALKKDGAFTPEAQKEAFAKTFNAVMLVLSEDAIKYINETFGDLDQYLTQMIEAEVNKLKD